MWVCVVQCLMVGLGVCLTQFTDDCCSGGSDWLVLSSPLLQLQLYAVDTRWSTRAPTTTWSRPTATCPTRTGCSCPRPWATLARDPSPWQCRRVRSPHGDPTTCNLWTVWPLPWWIWRFRWDTDLIKRHFSFFYV